MCVCKHLSSSVLRRYHLEDSKARLSNLESSEDRLEIGRDRLFRLHKNCELNHCSEVMLWIWQLSHLGDSKARLFSLGVEWYHWV